MTNHKKSLNKEFLIFPKHDHYLSTKRDQKILSIMIQNITSNYGIHFDPYKEIKLSGS